MRVATFAAAAALALSACGRNEPPPSSEPRPTVAATPKGWVYHTVIDQMDDHRTSSACLEGEPLYPGTNLESPLLCYHERPGRNPSLVITPGNNEIIDCAMEYCGIRVREDAQLNPGVVLDMKDVPLPQPSAPLMGAYLLTFDVAKYQNLLIELPIVGKGMQVFTFHPNGLVWPPADAPEVKN